MKLEPVPLDPAPTDGALRRNLDAALAQVAVAANMGSRSCVLVAKTPSNSISAVGDLNDHGRVAMAQQAVGTRHVTMARLMRT